MTAELIHRLHFAFTITFHYLFPQLTMGLGLLIVALKSVALKTGSERWDTAARFWGRIFAINFVFGVVTGIPMEFEFGTNWARFSRLSGGVIGQPLAMEGVFSFFLESAFLGLFLYGEKRISKLMHWFSAVMVFAGSWISGFFIIVTDAWMQHPVAYQRMADGHFEVLSFWQLLLNPWGLLQYAHNMTGAVVTGSFVMAATGAFYLLEGQFEDYGRIFLKVAVITGVIASILIIFPTGDLQGKFVAHNQPAAIAGMEGLFHSEAGAGLVLMGQPNEETGQIDNPIVVNDALSLRNHQSRSKRSGPVSAGSAAHRAAAALLRLPHHGWPRHLVCAADDRQRVSALAQAAFHRALGAVGAAAQLPIALHRQHRRLAHSRVGPPALAHLRPDAHQRGLLEHRLGQQRPLHAAGLHGALSAARDALYCAHLSRDQQGTGAQGH
jgi:cytochrome bd-type quinol oxidase subunit 1